MKTQIKVVTLSAVILLGGLTGCSNQAPRITPGFLEVSSQVETHSAKITNIVELSEKEVTEGKKLKGVLTGALIGAAITKDASDSSKHAGVTLGGFFGKKVVLKKHGKTIYRLSLSLDDGTQKEVYLRGGHYQIGSTSRVTLNKSSGEITSFKLTRGIG